LSRGAKFLLITLTPFLAATQPSPLPAQSQERPPAVKPGGQSTESLQVFILEGNGATNTLVQPMPSMVVVEVRDENSRPVEGAEVVFELPATGPGGRFSEDQSIRMARTNSQGQAGVTFVPNSVMGRFNIKVSATLGNRSGQAVISQSNALRPASSSSAEKRRAGRLLNWKVLLIAGGVVGVVAVVLATRGGSSSATAAPPPTITLTPGTPTFGTP
jgi:hypothetical protein